VPEFLNKPATSSTIQTVKRQTRSFKQNESEVASRE